MVDVLPVMSVAVPVIIEFVAVIVETVMPAEILD